MPRIAVDQVTLHYQQLGRPADAGEIVAVHGLASDLAFWYLAAAPLLADRYRITMYDLRGHGLSDSTPHGYRSADLAADLLGLIAGLRLDRPIVIGHSFGAAIALHAAVLAPRRLAGVVIADGYLPCFDRAPDARPGRRLQRSVDRLRHSGTDLPSDLPRVAYASARELADLRTTDTDPGLAGLRRWTALRERSAAAVEVTDRSLQPRMLAASTVPWLAVYGDRSPCRTTLRGIRRARPATEVVRIADAGHLYPYRRPRPFADQVLGFADRILDQHRGAADPAVISGA